MGTGGLERLPAVGREDLRVRLVRQLRVGDRGLALERLGLVGPDLLEPLVDDGLMLREGRSYLALGLPVDAESADRRTPA